MTIKVLLLLLALVIVTVRAYAFEAPCFVEGEKQEYRAFGDFGAVLKQTGDCEIARVTPYIFECKKSGNNSNVFDWFNTGHRGTSFFVLNVHGEEVGYYWTQSDAEFDLNESDCSGEI